MWSGNECDFYLSELEGLCCQYSRIDRSVRTPAGFIHFSLLLSGLLILGCSPPEPSWDEELETVDWQGLTRYPQKCAKEGHRARAVWPYYHPFSSESWVGAFESDSSRFSKSSGSRRQQWWVMWEDSHGKVTAGTPRACLREGLCAIYVNWWHGQSIVY